MAQMSSQIWWISTPLNHAAYPNLGDLVHGRNQTHFVVPVPLMLGNYIGSMSENGLACKFRWVASILSMLHEGSINNVYFVPITSQAQQKAWAGNMKQTDAHFYSHLKHHRTSLSQPEYPDSGLREKLSTPQKVQD